MIVLDVVNTYLLNIDEKFDPVLALDKVVLRGTNRGNSLTHAVASLQEFTSGLDSCLNGYTFGALSEEMGEDLIDVFRLCVKGSYIPEFLKLKRLVRIPKPFIDMSDIRASRILTVQNAFNALLGKIITFQESRYFEEVGIYSPKQYGFRPRHSCGYAVAEILHRIVNTPKSCEVVVVFIDKSNAFGTIDHKLLMTRVEKFGTPAFQAYVGQELFGQRGVVIESRDANAQRRLKS